MQPLRVVSIIEATTISGPAKPLIEFARRMKQGLQYNGLPTVDMSILTFHRGSPGESNLFIDTARGAGLEVDVVYEQRPFQPSILAGMRRHLEVRQPHIVESNAVKSHVLARLLGAPRKQRWIACHHGYVTTNAKVRMYNQFDRWSLPAAQHVFTVCEPFSRELQRIGVSAERITVRHNMIDEWKAPHPSEVAALRERFGIAPDLRVVFTAGRLSREKGHLDLVEAVGRLRDASLPPFVVLVAGDGPERPAIERRCAELKLDNFRLIGHQPSVHTWYGLTDVFVLPSHSEGSPMALLEAMAAGLPVVATNVGGVPEIARGGENALVVPGRDAEAFAGALRRILTDEALAARLGESAREVTSRFNLEAYCRKTLTVYRAVAGSS